MPVTGPIGGRYHTTRAVVCLSLDPGQAEKTAPNGADGTKIKDLREERERKRIKGRRLVVQSRRMEGEIGAAGKWEMFVTHALHPAGPGGTCPV